MDRLEPEQRLQIVELYYQNSCSVKNVFRLLRPVYGRHNRPSERAIQQIVDKFRTSFTLLDLQQPNRVRRVRTEENIAAVSAGGIIGPYFFKDEGGRNVTVNGERYRSMITNFFLPKMEELNSVDMWFQQDGATSHTAGETMDQLRDQFGERLISRFGAVNWPPRSCDLTPLDFFLWGYVKSLVYTDNPNSIAALETNIERVMAEIPVEMCEKVCQNWTFRMDHLKRSRGQHLHEIIFKK